MTRMGHFSSYSSPIQSFQEKENKFYTPRLPYVMSRQNYDVPGMLIIGDTGNFALVWYSEKGGLGICLIHYLSSSTFPDTF